MGLSKDGLERFDAVAASHVGDGKVPGLVALVAQGDDAHVTALGTLGVGGRPAERESLFRIASTTKPITAILGGRGWGLGTSVVLDGPWTGATGWDGGLGTSFLVHPARDLVVIAATQRMFSTPRSPAVHTDLQAAALAAAQ